MSASRCLVAILIACNGEATPQALAPAACINAPNLDPSENFGRHFAHSDDGTTLAVGAPGQEPFGDLAGRAGAVYVFTRTETGWVHEAYLEASSSDFGDSFGSSLALSADGAVLVVGAPGEDSAATDIGGDQQDNSVVDAGAVFVFSRDATGWSEQAYVKAPNTDAFDRFGQTVALSDDGATLAVSAYLESSASSGVDGDQASNTAQGSGAVYVFARSGSSWMQQAYVKASNTEAQDINEAISVDLDGTALSVNDSETAAART